MNHHWKKKDMLTLLLLVLAILLLPLHHGAYAEKRDTLVVSIGTKPLGILNPAYTILRPILVLYHNWGDTLLYRDPVLRKLVPCLAESWQPVHSGAIEFKLRKGVRFHNGEPFNARAVQFSMRLLKEPGSLISPQLAGLEAVSVIDEYTLRIETSVPIATALEIIANALFIYPPDYYQKVGKEGFNAHPIGTGPYRFVSFQGQSSVSFTANTDYFGGPKGKAGIAHLKAVTVPEEMLHFETLLSGEADLVRSADSYQEYVPVLKHHASLQIKTTPILRVCFLTMDAKGRSGVSFFKDKRVRMAVNHAIDKERLIQQECNGYGQKIDTITSPLHFGHEPNVTRYAYDPARAKRLLSEAGYANGFTVDFYVSMQESMAEAIARDLHAVGISTHFHWMGGKWEQFYQKFLQGEMPLALMTWGSYSIFDSAAILNPFFVEDEKMCYGTTPGLIAVLNKANRTVDEEKRRELLSAAQKTIADEAFCAPLFNAHAISVMKRGLRFTPSYDEIDRYFTAIWE